MKKFFSTLFQLTSLNKIFEMTILPALLGTAAAGGEFGLRFLILISANILFWASAFAFNYLESAPVDVIDPQESLRNPIAAGEIKPKNARIISLISGLLSLVLFIQLGWISTIFGTLAIILAILFSYHNHRLNKSIFFQLDVHNPILVGLQIFFAFFTFSNKINFALAFSLILLLSYAWLVSVLKDEKSKSENANLKKAFQLFIFALLGLVIISALFTFFVLKLFPT